MMPGQQLFATAFVQQCQRKLHIFSYSISKSMSVVAMRINRANVCTMDGHLRTHRQIWACEAQLLAWEPGANKDNTCQWWGRTSLNDLLAELCVQKNLRTRRI